MTRITVQISIQSNIDKVWEYWTKPEHITHWNFASEDWSCPNAENDLKPNGKFCWRMEAKDGSMGFDFTGVYDKITDKAFISYKIQDGRQVDIEFIQNSDSIDLRETFDPENIHTEEQQRAGWQAILENFKKYVEGE